MPLAFRIARISTSTMSGRQAKLLSDQHLTNLLRFAQASRYPARNRLIVLLSFKAGLRAAEIAKLTWAMLVDATGAIAPVIELHDQAAKNCGGPTHSTGEIVRR
jgi:integrase